MHRVGLHVEEFERAGREVQLHVHPLTSFDVDAPEGSQRAQRAVGILQVADVHLHHFRAVAPSLVGDRHVEPHYGVACLSAQCPDLRHTPLAYLKVGVAQTIAEGEQGIGEVAIGAPLHRIILVVGQLFGGAIERDGQFATGVAVTEEHVGHSRSALLPGIPHLQDGIARFRLGLQGNGRARTVDQYDALAGILQGPQEVALHLGQFYAGAVATAETFHTDGHLLALQSRRNATHEDHRLRTLQLVDNLLVVDGAFLGHIYLHVAAPRLHVLVAHLDVVRPTGLGIDDGARGRAAPTVGTLLALAVDVHLVVSRALHRHHIFAGLARCELCLVASREIGQVDARGKVVHTRCGHAHRTGVVLRSDGLSLHLRIVPEGAPHALAASHLAGRAQEFLLHPLVHQVAAGQVD